jgi:hypothetical protein
MMLKYEQETGEIVGVVGNVGDLHYLGYVEWLEAKATAYDRLMSGNGKMTMKEMANFKGRPITVDGDWTIKAHGAEYEMIELEHGSGYWANDADDYEEIEESFVEIPDDLDWKESLTLPDRWEAMN